MADQGGGGGGRRFRTGPAAHRHGAAPGPAAGLLRRRRPVAQLRHRRNLRHPAPGGDAVLGGLFGLLVVADGRRPRLLPPSRQPPRVGRRPRRAGSRGGRHASARRAGHAGRRVRGGSDPVAPGIDRQRRRQGGGEIAGPGRFLSQSRCSRRGKEAGDAPPEVAGDVSPGPFHRRPVLPRRSAALPASARPGGHASGKRLSREGTGGCTWDRSRASPSCRCTSGSAWATATG